MTTTSSIVFFTQLYHPDMTTTAIIMTDLAEDLASYGMDVGVVSAQPTYLIKDDCLKKEVRNDVSIRRVFSFHLDKNKNVGRILNSLTCFMSMFFALFSTKRQNLLVFNTNPALLPFLGYIAAKLRGQRYVVLIHDLWPELPAHIGMIKKDGIIYKIIDFLLTHSYKNASAVIVLSEAMKKTIAEKVPGKNNNIFVLHNWADTKRVYPVSEGKNDLLRELNIGNKKVVMYSGNLGRYQPLGVMIDTAKELRDRVDILFVFVGDGTRKPILKKRVADYELNNIKFLPFQPLDRLAESLSMADVSLMGIMPKNEGVIMPSKLYGLLAVGRPIICVCDPESEVAGILNKAGAGLQTSVEDPKELAEKIVSILDNSKKAEEMGQNGIKYFQENFERKIITRQWRDLLQGISTGVEKVDSPTGAGGRLATQAVLRETEKVRKNSEP